MGSLLFSVLVLGCNESHSGHDDGGPDVDSAVMCGPCDDAVQLRIMGVSDPTSITVDGADLTCTDAGSFVYCGIRSLPPGRYSLTVSAPGMTPEDVFFDLGAPVGDVCPCVHPFSQLITLRPAP